MTEEYHDAPPVGKSDITIDLDELRGAVDAYGWSRFPRRGITPQEWFAIKAVQEDRDRLRAVPFPAHETLALRQEVKELEEDCKRLRAAAEEVRYEIDRQLSLSETPQLRQIEWWRGRLNTALEGRDG